MHDKLQENEELERQLQQARQTISMHQQTAKPAVANATSRAVTPIRSAEDKAALEEAQRRIFSLEDQNQQLHRQLEVEQRKEVRYRLQSLEEQ